VRPLRIFWPRNGLALLLRWRLHLMTCLTTLVTWKWPGCFDFLAPPLPNWAYRHIHIVQATLKTIWWWNRTMMNDDDDNNVVRYGACEGTRSVRGSLCANGIRTTASTTASLERKWIRRSACALMRGALCAWLNSAHACVRTATHANSVRRRQVVIIFCCSRTKIQYNPITY